MSIVESETGSGPNLRATPRPVTLRCEACGEETIILPGCANDTWLCGHCGAAIRQTEPAGPRQKKPVIAETPRPSVPLEMLDDELARLTMEQGLRRRPGDPRLTRLFQLSGVFSRIPGDPRVPKVVRVYGTAFTMLGTMAVVAGVYSLLFSGARYVVQTPGASFPVIPLLTLVLAVVQIGAGNGLRLGRRAAVYAAALVCVSAIGYCAWTLPYPYAPFLVGLIGAPLFVSAMRHWGRFH
ncbi:MAG: hypothetical protein HZB26_18215 [Candidatus Hydrogenedentes bacterium]|nr:hypothetical protein [Candidatus Hydrogenedentota bacterium]